MFKKAITTATLAAMVTLGTAGIASAESTSVDTGSAGSRPAPGTRQHDDFLLPRECENQRSEVIADGARYATCTEGSGGYDVLTVIW
ncbi:hypothetical protein [Nocardia sp. BMG111209]|uniref:hypothetical protein n=1 Tax=Nocardia sp. BMG111209 TaxID=1160137 RepID=UPI0003780CFE|nr:hypothetical protein [Nocardia sp. BMG111209]